MKVINNVGVNARKVSLSLCLSYPIHLWSSRHTVAGISEVNQHIRPLNGRDAMLITLHPERSESQEVNPVLTSSIIASVPVTQIPLSSNVGSIAS